MKNSNYKFLLFFLTTIFPFSFVYASEPRVSNFECVFNRHYAAYLHEDNTERYNKAPTQLSFIGNKTTSSTLNLDGDTRATNSTKWTLIVSNSTGAKYTGNSGDLLTIFYEPGAGDGEYKASLQWSGLGYAFSSIGVCKGRP